MEMIFFATIDKNIFQKEDKLLLVKNMIKNDLFNISKLTVTIWKYCQKKNMFLPPKHVCF